MPQSTGYLRSYLARDLRRFEAWDEQIDRVPSVEGDPVPITGETVLYLHDTYVVTGGILPDAHVVFDAITEDWIDFCRDDLGFAVPEIDNGP